MAQTAKYCGECASRLSPADNSPQDREFFAASLFEDGNHPDGKRLRSEYGACEKCGREGVVTFYEFETTPTPNKLMYAKKTSYEEVVRILQEVGAKE